MRVSVYFLVIVMFVLTCCSSDSQDDPSPDPSTDLSATGSFVFLNTLGIYLGKPIDDASDTIETTLLYDPIPPNLNPASSFSVHNLNIDQRGGYVYWSTKCCTPTRFYINRAPLKKGVVEVLYDIEDEFERKSSLRRTFAIDALQNKLYVVEVVNNSYIKIYEGNMDGSSDLLNIHTSDSIAQNPFTSIEAFDLHYSENNLYWVENRYNDTRVMNFNIAAKSLTTLFDEEDELDWVTNISVDGVQKKIYISDRNPSSWTGIIYSRSLNGTDELTTVAEGAPLVYYPRDLRIDANKGHLFWSNSNKLELMRMDVNDNKIDTIKIKGPLGGGLDFAVLSK